MHIRLKSADEKNLREARAELEKLLAADLNRQALAALARIGAWLDALTVLDNLSDFLDETESIGCLAQALWIALRIQAPLPQSFNLCAQLFQKTGGIEADPAPLLAGAMTYFLRTRGENHPQREELTGQISGVFSACAQARDISGENIQEWLKSEGLLDPARLAPALDAMIENWVVEWHFDREGLARQVNRP